MGEGEGEYGENQIQRGDAWTYVGEGEWALIDRSPGQKDPIRIERENSCGMRWMESLDEDIKLHYEVIRGGYPNRYGAKRQVKSKWNLELLQELLMGYEDKEVVEWLRYGWPTGRLPGMQEPKIWGKNHEGAEDHPEALRAYIKKELGKGAIMGPYKKIPFQGKVGISPLSTRAKKCSQERRVILDLSFPIGEGVNDGIPKDTYLGLQAKLTFPKTDEFAYRIFQLGNNCMMFKVDLSRYFRQLPLDPGDYSLIGYMIGEEIYFDKVLPMGMRSAPYIAQRVTNAIAHIHRKMEPFLLNYVDDFVSAEMREKIWEGYIFLTNLLKKLGVDTSKEKLVEPTTRMEFLGVTFDTEKMTMELPEEKVIEITKELHTWLYKSHAVRREVESLIGKLQFAAKCIKMGRIFIARLINWLRGMTRQDKYHIPLEARKDIAW